MKTSHMFLLALIVITGCQTTEVQTTNSTRPDPPKEQYILEYKRKPSEKEHTGFYSKGNDLSVVVEKTVFPERKGHEFEYTEQRVTYHIKNHTDKLLILDLQEGDIQITSSVTSDSNYDNLGNHEPIQKIEYDTGLFALHPTTSDDSFPHIWKILRNQESYVSNNPLIKLVCFDNSCGLRNTLISPSPLARTGTIGRGCLPRNTGQRCSGWSNKGFTTKYTIYAKIDPVF